MMERKERKKKMGYILLSRSFLSYWIVTNYQWKFRLREDRLFFREFSQPISKSKRLKMKIGSYSRWSYWFKTREFFFRGPNFSPSLHRNSMEFFLIWFKLYQKKKPSTTMMEMANKKKKKRSHFDLNDFVSSKLIVQFGQKIIAIIAEKVKDLVNYYRFGARKKNFQQKDGGKGKMIWFKWIGNNFSPI